MNRRSFLQSAGVFVMTGLLAGHARALPGSGVIRFTTTTDALPRISAERRLQLAANPEGLSAKELNAQLPEINQIELKNSATDARPGETLRLIAWNLERGRAWRDAAKLIDEHPALHAPDILFLSEMDFGLARSNNEHTTRELAGALGMNYAYAVEFLELPRGKEPQKFAEENTWGYHGNAILSRAPLKNVRAVRFPGIEQWYGGSQNRLGGRMALFGEIETPRGPVTVVSTHLESGIQDDAVRARQSAFILEEIAAHAGAQTVLIGGDMNSWHARPAIKQYEAAGFCVADCNLLTEPTMVVMRDGEVRRAGFHIDYLITRGATPVHNDHSPAVALPAYPNSPHGERLSDHAPVALQVTLAQ